MPKEKDLECRAILLQETPNAIHVMASKSKDAWWLPRSQIGYLRKDKIEASSETSVVFTLPEWLIETKQCWELVP